MTKKLDKEHVEAIQSLQDRFAQNARQLGTLIIEQEFLETQRKSLDEARVSLLNDFSALREEENKLIYKFEKNTILTIYYEDNIIMVNFCVFSF